MSFLGLDLLVWALLGLLVVAIPVMGRSDLRNLTRGVARGDSDVRMKFYERTLLFEWGLVLLGGAAWLTSGRGLAELGLVPRVGFWEAFFAIIALGATVWFVSMVARTTRDPEHLQDVRGQLGPLQVAVPHTRRELARFDGLSVTAGICEEFLYRGMLMGLLAAAWGIWPAILVSSAVFGIGHAYQGPAGILRTGLVGLVLALMVVLTGSLFVAMIAHAAIDLSQGRMLLAAVNLPPEQDAAVLDAA